MRPNFARLNHVLIPATKDGRDAIRSRWVGKLAWPFVAFYGALTDEGRMVTLIAILVGGAGADVRNNELYVLWALLTGAVIASVLVRPFYSFDRARVRAEVDAPRCVLVGEEIVFGVTIHNEGARDLLAVRVSGPFLPWDGRWTGAAAGVPRVKMGGSARIELRARFVARGQHHLDSFGVATVVPLGLAKGRSLETAGTRFLVLPRIARVARLSMPEARRDQSGGIALASKTGESMELMGVRPYRPGDPVRHLHARTWARTGEPIVREYHEELFRRVAVVLDVDPRDEARTEAAIALTAGVVSHLARGEAIIDLFVVAGARVHDLTLGRSLGFLEQALELLACIDAGSVASDDAAPLLSRLEPSLERLSSVVVVDGGARGERGRASKIVDHVKAYGVGSLWLEVVDERRARARGRRATPAVPVAIEAIERGEELVL